MFLKSGTSAGSAIVAGSLITHADLESVSGQMNTNSKPSALRITDVRVAIVAPSYERDYRCLVRIDTNQGLSGYGDVRGRASKTYALILKSRILGMNPCNVAEIFYKIKQHGSHGVMGGGVSAVEMACWDLAGKAWNVPVWQMLGGKFRDRILLYADTESSRSGRNGPAPQRARCPGIPVPEDGSEHPQTRRDGECRPARSDESRPSWTAPWAHSGPARPISSPGVMSPKRACAPSKNTAQPCASGSAGGPIATNHYGSFNVENIIKFARAVDKFNFAWLEDTVPWQFADDLVRIKNSCTTPILTGEDIYLATGFRELFEKRAISIAHPDPAECGGILEAKKIADLAAQYGIATAFHNHNNPTTLFASLHAAAAAEQFMALEFHNGDHTEEFLSVVKGGPKPLIRNGFIDVPDGPGLGFEYDLDALKKWVKEPGFFEPTKEWDGERSFDGQFL